MKVRGIAVSLFIAACIDLWISYAFPVNFLYQGLSIQPHICFVSLLILMDEKSDTDRILAAVLCGALYDFLFISSFPISTILFPIFAWSIGPVKKWIGKNVEYRILYLLFTVFLLDFIPYIVTFIVGIIHVHLGTWLLHMELMTILFHALIIFVLIYFYNYLEHSLEKRRIQKATEQKSKYRSVNE